jgi:hypothetical protein
VASVVSRSIDRVLCRPKVVRRAVMLLEQERRNIMPTVCVKSGVRTDGAMRVRAIETRHVDAWTIAIGTTLTALVLRLARRRVEQVSIPVSEAVWRTWRSRLSISVLLVSIGLPFLLIGIVRGLPGLIALGAITTVAGWLNRVRAWHNAWIGVELRPRQGEVVVSRVHSGFDEQARRLYTKALLARSKR